MLASCAANHGVILRKEARSALEFLSWLRRSLSYAVVGKGDSSKTQQVASSLKSTEPVA